MENYARRFREFLGLLPSSKSLDDPAVMPQSEGGPRADYLLFQRSMIVEVKELENDPGHKVDAIIERYKGDPSYPLFFGHRQLADVLAHMPRGLQDEIRERVFKSVSSAIEGNCRSANQQIRATRAFFDLPEASGILFLLNNDIQVLSPDVLGARVEQQMHRRREDGSDRFAELSHVIIWSWAHFIAAADGRPAHPIIYVEGPAIHKAGRAREQIDYIVYSWTEHMNGVVTDHGKATKELLENYQTALPPEAPAQIRAQDSWQIAYRSDRYLKALPESALLDVGRALLAEGELQMTGRGGPGGSMPDYLQRWTHFLEECSLRNLDMRKLQVPSKS